MNRKLLRFHRRVRRASKKVARDRRPRPALFQQMRRRPMKAPNAMIVHCSQGGTKSVAWRD